MSDFDVTIEGLFARQPNRMIPDLARITTLTELLGRPDQAFPAIQVTGTNGKTTITHMISALLSALGVAPGSYTSPHLQDVRERIRVAGELITVEELADGLIYLDPFVTETDERHPESLTFFEILTALSFVHFADKPVDVGVYEVGMGGTWDATNLVRGEVAVINSISLDHLELGSTVGQIAGEKAGVIKPGATVISAVQDADAAAAIDRAAADQGASVVLAGRDFGIESRGLAVGGQYLTLRGVTGEIDEIFLPLYGAHQGANAAVALAAVEGFLGFSGGLDPDIIREGFAAVRSPGRLEVVPRGGYAPIVLDGAHNPAGAHSLAVSLQAEFAYRHRVFVLGVLDDKDVEGVVEALVPVADHVVVTEPPSSRAAASERVEQALKSAGVSVEIAPDVASAIDLASGVAAADDGVIVTGSLYMVGAARDHLGLAPA